MHMHRQARDRGGALAMREQFYVAAQDGKDAESDDDKRAPAPSIKMWLI